MTFRTPNLIPALIHGLLLQMALWNHFLSTDHCHCKLGFWAPKAYVHRGWLGLYLCSSRRKSPRRFWSAGWWLCGWNVGRFRALRVFLDVAVHCTLTNHYLWNAPRDCGSQNSWSQDILRMLAEKGTSQSSLIWRFFLGATGG